MCVQYTYTHTHTHYSNNDYLCTGIEVIYKIWRVEQPDLKPVFISQGFYLHFSSHDQNLFDHSTLHTYIYNIIYEHKDTPKPGYHFDNGQRKVETIFQ